MKLVEFAALVDEVEALLRALLRRPTGGGGGGVTSISNTNWQIIFYGDDEALPVSTHTTTDRPPNYDTDPTGATPFTAELFEGYLCAQAHLIWNTVDDLLEYGQLFTGWLYDTMAWVQHLGSYVLDYLYALSDPARATIFSVEELSAWHNASSSEVTAGTFQAARTEWLSAKDAILCALIGETSGADWKAAFDAIVASSVTDAAVTSIILGGIPAALFSLIFEGLLKPDNWADEECPECEWVPEEGDYRIELDIIGSTDFVYEYSSTSEVTITFPDVATYRYYSAPWYQFGGYVKLYKYISSSWTRVQFQWTAHTLSPIPNNEGSSYGVTGKQSDGAGDYFQYDGSTPTLPTNVAGGLSVITLNDASMTQGNAGFTGTVTLTSLT